MFNIDKDILEKIYDNLDSYSEDNTLEALIEDCFLNDYFITYMYEAKNYFLDHLYELESTYEDYTDCTGEVLNPFDIIMLVNTLISFRVYYTLEFIGIDYNDTCNYYLTNEFIENLKTTIDNTIY